MTETPPDLLTRTTAKLIETAERTLNFWSRFQPPPDTELRRNDHLQTLVVREVRAEAEDVVSLTLAAQNGAELPAWDPGCHLDVLLPSGLKRQYSLNGDPADRHSYRISVRRLPDGGGGSVQMHQLRTGHAVTVSHPRNAFPFIGRDRYLFLAGGIGITPILPMVRAAQRIGAGWQLIYTGRSRESMPFARELLELGGDRVFIRPDEEFGFPTGEELIGDTDPGTHIYLCGPPPMIDTVRRAAQGPLHYERFSPPPVVNGTPFEVELARTGVVVEVGAEESALTAILREVPTAGYSCRQGFCGACRIPVLGGTFERNDHAMSRDGADRSMTVCVSRAEGRVVLDI
ncbi:oxidoreductase [Pseudonocardiaceae bacterium YIM PH 21723]|nr:oxidoreductase [Pseudonocardiaceae bacterium YIM PH 21723]